MKKIISTLLTVAMLFSISVLPVMADPTAQFVEKNGKIDIDLAKTAIDPAAQYNADFERTKYVGWMMSPTSTEAPSAPYAEFTVWADSESEYSLSACGEDLGVAHGSDWSVTVNPEGTAATYNMTNDTVEYINKKNNIDSEFKYKNGKVALKSGLNTIRITALEYPSTSLGNRVIISNIYFSKREIHASEKNDVITLKLFDGPNILNPMEQSNATLSNYFNAGFEMAATDKEGTAPWVTYGIEAEGGIYKLSTEAFFLNSKYTGDWTLTVDDTTTYTWVGNSVETVTASNWRNIVYNTGIPLEKGYHTLKIKAGDDYKETPNVTIKTITLENGYANAKEENGTINLKLIDNGNILNPIEQSNATIINYYNSGFEMAATDTEGTAPWVSYSIKAEGGIYKLSTESYFLNSPYTGDWTLTVDDTTTYTWVGNSVETVTNGNWRDIVYNICVPLEKGYHTLKIQAGDDYKENPDVYIKTITLENNFANATEANDVIDVTLGAQNTYIKPIVSKSDDMYFAPGSVAVEIKSTSATKTNTYVDIAVKADGGAYRLSFDACKFAYSQAFSITVDPGTDNESVYQLNSGTTTEVPFTSPNYMANYTLKDNCVQLSEGIHTLRIMAENGGLSNAGGNMDRIMIKNLKLERNPVQFTADADGSITMLLYDGNGVVSPLTVAPSTTVTVGEGEGATTKTISTKYEASLKTFYMYAYDGAGQVTGTDYQPWVEFCVDSASAGYYSVTGSGVAFDWSGDFDITVNGKTSYSIGRNSIAYVVNDGTVRDYNYTPKCIYLEEGKNVIRFTCTTCNTSSVNLSRMMTSYIKFTKINGFETALKAVTANAEEVGEVLPTTGNPNAAVNLVNGTTEEKTAVIVAAIYSGKTLKSLDYVPVTLAAGAKVTNSDAIFDLTRADGEKLNVKLFVWDKDTLEPFGATLFKATDAE